MTTVRVRRLSLRCTAPHDARDRALDARARLERVAAGPLAAALDAALGGLDADVRIDSLRVRLDLDPRDHDDDSLAWLWAGRIAAALTPHLCPAPPAAPAWVEQLLALGPRDVASVAALLVADGAPDVPPGRRAAVLTALHRAAASAAPGAAGPGPGDAWRTTPRSGAATRPTAGRPGLPAPDGPPGPRSPAADLTGVPPAPAGRAGRSAPSAAGGRPVPPVAEPVPGAAAWQAAAAAAPAPASPAARAVARAAGAAVRRATAHGLDREGCRSAAGGLVLLYPWLAACVPTADMPPQDARRVAYAGLAGDRALQHDPLVRLLAGLAPDAPTDDVDLDVDAHVAPVLRAFAGLLPGFERSSVGYLQQHLVRRAASLEQLPEVVLVRLAPGPLDPVLRRLPYPLGLLALPWTPPLAVELRC